jgi:hypothetical protein
MQDMKSKQQKKLTAKAKSMLASGGMKKGGCSTESPMAPVSSGAGKKGGRKV